MHFITILNLQKINFRCFSFLLQMRLKESLKTSKMQLVILANNKKKTKFQYKCIVCKFEDSSYKGLRQHIKLRHASNKLYKCSLCEYNSTEKRRVAMHLKVRHSDNKPFKCPQCDYIGALKEYLINHMKAKHPKERLQCHLCDYKASIQRNLMYHMKVKHSEDKPFSCDLCNYSTAIEKNLSNHKFNKHSDSKPHSCTFCGFEAALKQTLKQHIKIKHSDCERYQCSLCDYSTPVRATLDNHKESKHSATKAYLCKLCDYSCAVKRRLDIHIKCKHSSTSPQFSFKCTECDYTTSYKYNLLRHQNSKHLGKETKFEPPPIAPKHQPIDNSMLNTKIDKPFEMKDNGIMVHNQTPTLPVQSTYEVPSVIQNILIPEHNMQIITIEASHSVSNGSTEWQRKQNTDTSCQWQLSPLLTSNRLMPLHHHTQAELHYSYNHVDMQEQFSSDFDQSNLTANNMSICTIPKW